jgi:hypothetical protein
MPLPRRSSQRQLPTLNLPIHQPPHLHPSPRSPDRRGDSGPVGSKKKFWRRSHPPLPPPPHPPNVGSGQCWSQWGTYHIGPFQVVTCTTGKPRILLFLRILEAWPICSSPFYILTVLHGMTLSSSLRLYSPLSNGSGFSLKPERMSPVTTDDRLSCQT